ncbi:hypothetical protein ASE23_20400 [Rhizobium sp. Root73]|nr:hypothetical protein ASE23_20400 [Rhizobium sp. Root73]
MTGAEIEDVARTTAPGETGAEHFSTGKPRDEHGFQRFRHGELLAVHFLVFEYEVLVQASCNRMARVDHPQAFPLTRLTPFQRARRAHQPLERF